MLERGLVQIYTGRGKGKTTAAIGLAIRAVGHGNKVLIYQFLKPSDVGELGERRILSNLDNITLKILEESWDMRTSLEDEKAVTKTKKAISDAVSEIKHLAATKEYDVIILDEIVFCLKKSLALLDDIRDIIDKKDNQVEIVMTGRGANAELIELADLVTEMKAQKHPFNNGVGARKGIEY